jgi:hypothetical protein
MNAAPRPVAASAAPPAAPVDLRPLTTSELIDRGFALYRQNFAGLFLLALLCQIAPFATSEALIAFTKMVPPAGGALAAYGLDPLQTALLLIVSVIGQIITFCFEVVITFYLAEAYLGRDPSIKAGFLRLGTRVAGSVSTSLLNMILVGLTLVFPLLAIAGIYVWSQLYPPGSFYGLVLFILAAGVLLVASLAPVLIVFMRLMVTVPVVALEGLAGWSAARRSSTLVRFDPGLGFLYWGEMRLSFLLLPLFAIELLTLSITSLPVTLHQIDGLLRHGSMGQLTSPPDAAVILSQVLVLLTGSLLLPLYLIATTLFYYDVRIRREGFDLEFMAGQIAAAK